MKEFFISGCSQQENKIVTSSFVVASKQVKAKKQNGEPYLALVLADRTGQIEAKMWDNVEEFIHAFEQDDFLKVKGLINKHKNRFQLTIHKLRRMEESEIDFTDYPPKTTKDIGVGLLRESDYDLAASQYKPRVEGSMEGRGITRTQVELEHGTTRKVYWLDKPVSVGHRITLAEEGSEQWTVTQICVTLTDYLPPHARIGTVTHIFWESPNNPNGKERD
jgi:DNA polymerase III alpha subunit